MNGSSPTSPLLTRAPGAYSASGWPPPEDAKRQHLLFLFHSRGHELLVESGTYLGGTIEFFLPHASRIVSVEIDPDLCDAARARFLDQPRVDVLLGDSTALVPRLVTGAETPPLVWLDGHYSGGETGRGIEDEPALTILRRLAVDGVPAGTTIAIDDLRLFGFDPAWPTFEELATTVRILFPAATAYAQCDALVIHV